MKKVLVAVAALAMIVSSAMPAAAKSGCVSQAEFNKVKNGISLTQLQKITGAKGDVTLSSGSGSFKMTIIDFKACAAYGVVNFGFLGGKLNSKTGIF